MSLLDALHSQGPGLDLKPFLSSLDKSELSHLFNELSDEGSSPLHLAARAGGALSARLLLSHGGGGNTPDRDSWSSPLHVALQHGNLGAALVLLEGGSKLDDAEAGALAARCARGSLAGWSGVPMAAAPRSTRCPRDKDGLTPFDCLALAAEPLLRAMAAERQAVRRRLRDAPQSPAALSLSSRRRGHSSGSGSGGGSMDGGRRRRRGAELVQRQHGEGMDACAFTSAPAAFEEEESGSSSSSSTCSSSDSPSACSLFPDLAALDWASEASLPLHRQPGCATPGPVPSDVPLSGTYSLPKESLSVEEGGAGRFSSSSSSSSPLPAPQLTVPQVGACSPSQWSWLGSVHVWGEDRHQLGHFSTSATVLPRTLDVPAAAATADSAAADSPPPTIVAMACSTNHSLLLTEQGQVLAFGSDGRGLLGLGRAWEEGSSSSSTTSSPSASASTPSASTPVYIPFFLALKVTVSSVAAGERHSLALASGGAVYAWGDGKSGALGLGQYFEPDTPSTSPHSPAEERSYVVSTPRRVEGGLKRSGQPVITIAAGAYHSVVVTGDGGAWVWGNNWCSQLGLRDFPSGGAGSAAVRAPKGGTALSLAGTFAAMGGGLSGSSGGSSSSSSSGSGSEGSDTPWICWQPRRTDPLLFWSGGASSGSGSAASAASFSSSSSSLACMFLDDQDALPAAVEASSHSIVAVAAGSSYTLQVTAEGEVWWCGRGDPIWARVHFDAAAADQADALAAYKESCQQLAGGRGGSSSSGGGAKMSGGGGGGVRASTSALASPRKKAEGSAFAAAAAATTPTSSSQGRRSPVSSGSSPVPVSAPAPVPAPSSLPSNQRICLDLSQRGFHVVAAAAPAPAAFSASAASSFSAAAPQQQEVWEVSQGSRSAVVRRAAAAAALEAASSGGGGSGSGGSGSGAAAAAAAAAGIDSSKCQPPPLRPAFITAVSAGPNHALALDKQGGVWSWGATGQEELLGWHRKSAVQSTNTSSCSSSTGSGGGSTTAQLQQQQQLFSPTWHAPRRLPLLSRAPLPVTRISAGARHSACCDSQGRVFTWGGQHAADRGLLGHPKAGAGAGAAGAGAGGGCSLGTPQRITSLAQVLDVCAGPSHTLAVSGVYLPPLPPLRPSVCDAALAVLGAAGGGAGTLPRVALLGAACSCTHNSSSNNTSGPLKQEACWVHCWERHRLYSAVVREEALAGRVLAGFWRGSRVEEEAQAAAAAVATAAAAAPTFTPPSLRSLAERALTSSCAGAGMLPALSLLCLSQRLNSPGLAAYAAAFLSANAPAVLSFLASFKGKGLLGEAAEACAGGGQSGGGLLAWQWLPPLCAREVRGREAKLAEERRALYGAVEARVAGLVRPGGGAAALAGGVGGGKALSKALDAVVVADCIRTRSLLFSGTYGSSGSSGSGSGGGGGDGGEGSSSGRASAAASPVPFARGVVEMSAGGGAGASASSSAPSPVQCLAGGGGSSSSSSPPPPPPPSALPSYSSCLSQMHAHRDALWAAATGLDSAPPPLPSHLETTLPLDSAAAAKQGALDRLAATLAEAGCGAGQSGSSSPPRAAAAAALARSLSPALLEDAAVLARRQRKLQRKLAEAMALTGSARAELLARRGGGRGGGGAVSTGELPLPAEQLERLSRRLAWAQEVGVLAAHLAALHGALLRGGVEAPAPAVAALLSGLEGVAEAQRGLLLCGGSTASLTAAGCSAANPVGDIHQALRAAGSGAAVSVAAPSTAAVSTAAATAWKCPASPAATVAVSAASAAAVTAAAAAASAAAPPSPPPLRLSAIEAAAAAATALKQQRQQLQQQHKAAAALKPQSAQPALRAPPAALPVASSLGDIVAAQKCASDARLARDAAAAAAEARRVAALAAAASPPSSPTLAGKGWHKAEGSGSSGSSSGGGRPPGGSPTKLSFASLQEEAVVKASSRGPQHKPVPNSAWGLGLRPGSRQ